MVVNHSQNIRTFIPSGTKSHRIMDPIIWTLMTVFNSLWLVIIHFFDKSCNKALDKYFYYDQFVFYKLDDFDNLL
jgi:hypothetical protein